MISMMMVEYYKSIMGPPRQARSSSNLLSEIQALCPRVPTYVLQQAARPFTNAEIRAALQSIPSNKTPGPDGLTAEFYLKTWDFLGFEALGVPEYILRPIQACISSTYFSVAVNGGLYGFFAGSRGLRQGCPLSPYLFILGITVLSSMLDVAVAENQLGYHPGVGLVLYDVLFMSFI
ncbi:PREDICTED: uncharacterized protein LOC104825291 [Tarenaya hassleriana]|uniref:uncharacterized protein LOC104825291 n=1 Tax=Tarenaya hassleriana TaxID=28532 RepID=UPI00053CA84B|nr:PREDICTED: uncharacterized protein LOC104825291 [Tarenaya hassleriana]XP_019059487.1 PREDICTED: uncharacterized protein LOC104825291 [Tarenaya hassleriana]XP_019059488.1 PREDICTED: uncharacterized protein LOC104825291 [Tarenaya hassleriana]